MRMSDDLFTGFICPIFPSAIPTVTVSRAISWSSKLVISGRNSFLCTGPGGSCSAGGGLE